MEYSDLLVLKKDSGFVGTGWSRSVETAYKAEMELVIDALLLTVGAEEVDLDEGKANSTGS